MTMTVLLNIIKTIGLRPAESGGILGGKSNTLTHYGFDKTSDATRVTYSPDVEAVNKQLNLWNESAVRLSAFVHSHPGKNNKPSGGDLVYAKSILGGIDDMECLWLPIVNTIPDTEAFTITPWVVCRSEHGVELVRGQIEIESESAIHKWTGELVSLMNNVPAGVAMDSIELKAADLDWLTTVPDEHETKVILDRVTEAYDLVLMRNTCITAIGAGGSAEFLEQMARCGIGQFVLIDPDTVSETNIATQQTYLSDVERPKVDCIAERIKNINPSADVICIQKRLEELSDDEIRDLILGSGATGSTATRNILCGLTDNFYAQAQVNRIALNLGIPSLCAQLYKEGRAAEITFTYPGVTPACHRCMLSPRYTYYLERGYENDVTSHGTPIFATAMLNAVKGYIALAMIHHESGHKRWGNTLTRIKDRSLVQIRLDPDIADTLDMPTFDRVFEGADNNQLFFGEPVWIPQEPECPETGYPAPCPDCGGTGDLRQAIGTIGDTRFPAIRAEKTPAAYK
jgi:hypothetical protein